MHPNSFYSNLFNTNKRDEVFVIMSFHPQFDARWEDVFKPTIEDDLNFVANRVDYNTSGESIVHDILDGIANARLVLADITSISMTDKFDQTWPQRNGNVMWELGIAHTMRLPDEVLMIKSDHDPSIFDLTQFRAFPFDPANVVSARTSIKALAQDRLRSIDQTKQRKVNEAIECLDADSLDLMVANKSHRYFSVPRAETMGQVMEQTAVGLKDSIRHLLSFGIIKFDVKLSAEAHAYHWTDFGRAVLAAIEQG